MVDGIGRRARHHHTRDICRGRGGNRLAPGDMPAIQAFSDVYPIRRDDIWSTSAQHQEMAIPYILWTISEYSTYAASRIFDRGMTSNVT